MKTVKFKDLPGKVQTFLYENQHSLGYFCPENDIQLNWLHNISIWDKATDEERLAYAEWKYPKGTKIACIYNPSHYGFVEFHKLNSQGWIYSCGGSAPNIARYIYARGKWAEIISDSEKKEIERMLRESKHKPLISSASKEPTFKAGDEVDCFVENGSEKEWIPAIFYAKAFHEKRPWKECYVVAYKNTGNVDIVTELRKPDPDKVYREMAKEMIGNARVHEFTSIEYITVESAESMLIEALKKWKGL